MQNPTIRTLPVGPLRANAYIIYLPERDDVVVIDPGAEAERILAMLRGRRLAGVLLTHGHFDHIGAVAGLNAPILAIHTLDAAMLTTPALNLSTMAGQRSVQPAANRVLQDGDVIELAGMAFDVLHTPGHTVGSACFRCGNALFTGDTMFAGGGYGRTDFPGGSMEVLRRSLDRLLALEGDLTVYPGHDEPSTLAEERRFAAW